MFLSWIEKMSFSHFDGILKISQPIFVLVIRVRSQKMQKRILYKMANVGSYKIFFLRSIVLSQEKWGYGSETGISALAT